MDEIDNLIEKIWRELEVKVIKKEKISRKTFTSLQALKVVEEFGEIADMILRLWHARKDKKMSIEKIKKNLGKEIADTIIVLYILAKSQNIDIKKHLKDKIKFEIERWKAEP